MDIAELLKGQIINSKKKAKEQNKGSAEKVETKKQSEIDADSLNQIGLAIKRR